MRVNLRSHQRAFGALGLVVAVVSLSSSIRASVLDGPELLAVGKRAAASSKWHAYAWLNDHELLYDPLYLGPPRCEVFRLSLDDGRARPLAALNRRFTGVVIQVLRDAVARGDFRDDVSVELLRDMIFGAIEHQAWAYLRGEGDFSTDATAEGITRVIYGGMTVRPDDAPP